MTTALLLIFLAGIAEFFKDLSEEGKLKGYWDKNHEPMHYQLFAPIDGSFDWRWEEAWHGSDALELWWKVHWLQGPNWDWIPVWVRQYLAFRDGFHLLKFFSVNSWTIAFAITYQNLGGVGLDVFPVWLQVWLVVRLIWSSPETLGRPLGQRLNLWK